MGVESDDGVLLRIIGVKPQNDGKILLICSDGKSDVRWLNTISYKRYLELFEKIGPLTWSKVYYKDGEIRPLDKK